MQHFGFYETPVAALIAGRVVPGTRITLRQTLELVEIAARFAPRLGQLLRVAPAGDLGWAGREERLDEPTGVSLVVGVELASVTADDGPSHPLSIAQLRRAILAGRALPADLWSELASWLDADLARELRGGVDALHLVAAGPRAGARLAFGVLGGVGSDLRVQIQGIDVLEVSFGAVAVPVDDSSHATRVARAGAFKDPAYHLLARRTGQAVRPTVLRQRVLFLDTDTDRLN